MKNREQPGKAEKFCTNRNWLSLDMFCVHNFHNAYPFYIQTFSYVCMSYFKFK